ncbi:hypothetical protein C3492_38375 [Streptomyces sp. Ru62]|uniref:FxLYD domain-containing protein n=1 Tax=Streptomyces sp. Ru62 TaxID=2080745 RepID=UPI000CDD61EB|nr:FxLYD domain-containing protein [Streptomyces sp. Ru62]POX58393.1 hypothetical protein C3492_38375 [Streptomyces sp. Ru62]
MSEPNVPGQDAASSRTARPRLRPVVYGVGAALTGVLAVASCGNGNGNGNGRAGTSTPTAPATSNFSGTVPSGMSSWAESQKAQASASASAAASSASARADEFEASVAADAERARAEAQKQLAKVKGRGNATKDVSMTGVPLSQTHNVRALLVTMTNRTDKPASFAVQVNFSDSHGKVVETVVVGSQDVKPGQKAERYAISHKPPEPHLTAELAKAQRY